MFLKGVSALKITPFFFFFGVLDMAIYKARTLGIFFRKVAIDYVRYGYFWYIFREIPEGKNLEKIDKKILAKYGITTERYKRFRLGNLGKRKIAYVRYKRHFVLIATHGKNEHFDREKFYDVRESPLHFKGYTVSVSKANKPVVKIGKKRWKRIVEEGDKISLHNYNKVHGYIKSVGKLKFPGILRQQVKLFQRINKKRRTAGLPRIKVHPLFKNVSERLKE